MNDYKIQLRAKRSGNDYFSGYNVQYRIEPSQLNWFQKLFNKWHNLYYSHNDAKELIEIYHHSVLSYYTERYHTLSEIKDYENGVREDIKKYRNKHKNSKNKH